VKASGFDRAVRKNMFYMYSSFQHRAKRSELILDKDKVDPL
jgi:hypothetical protein